MESSSSVEHLRLQANLGEVEGVLEKLRNYAGNLNNSTNEVKHEKQARCFDVHFQM